MATCYRHPDRETGVSCSACARPICPDCMTTTSVGMRCPECAREKTKVVRRAYAGADPVLTYGLITLSVLAYFASAMGGSSVTSGGFGGSQVLVEGALSRHDVADGDLWRLITGG